VIHRTFRSLDEAPKLVGFTMRQWLVLIALTAAVLGTVYATGLAVKPAITLCVFLVGLPAALMYVSESGGLQLGVLLVDLVRWRSHRQRLTAVPEGFLGARGLRVLADDRLPACGPPASEVAVSEHGWALQELLEGERWRC
jgi:hypothetical protein